MNAVVCDYQSEMEEKEDDEAEMSRSENCCITYLSYRKMNGFFYQDWLLSSLIIVKGIIREGANYSVFLCEMIHQASWIGSLDGHVYLHSGEWFLPW